MPQNHYLIEICTLVNLNADLKSQILNFTTVFHKLKIISYTLISKEAVVRRCFVKKIFLKISQNSQETPVAEPLFW